MAKISQAVRLKRYQLKPGAEVQFVIQGPSGRTYNFELVNMSLTGIAAKAEVGFETNETLMSGTIFPAAKINAGSSELSLGRVVLRSIPEDWSKHRIVGLSLIDTKLPLMGKLSQYVTMDLDRNADPTSYELSPGKFNLSHFTENDEAYTDIFSKTRTFAHYFEEWEKTPKYGCLRVRTKGRGTRVHLANVRKNGRSDYISMGSNDYYGLASHPAIEEAALMAIKEYGFGSTGSPITSGMTSAHEELREVLSRIFKTDSCLLYNSGFVANIGIIDGLVGANDLVVADMLSHASLQDGMRLCRGQKRFFKHNDPAHLTQILARERNEAGGCLIITEGVFSMDGDVPPLRDIFSIARHNQARVLVDEAHSFGVIGEKGIGAVEEAGLLGKVDLVMGTFSKICGGIGGFVCGDKAVIDWLAFFSRPHMFSVSLPPAAAAAAIAALKIFEQDKERVKRLQSNIKHFAQGLRELGLDIAPNHRSAVVPVVIGDEEILGKIHLDLQEAGIFVIPIMYPAVSRKECRFRFTMTSELTSSDLDYTIMVLRQAFDKYGFHPEDFKK